MGYAKIKKRNDRKLLHLQLFFSLAAHTRIINEACRTHCDKSRYSTILPHIKVEMKQPHVTHEPFNVVGGHLCMQINSGELVLFVVANLFSTKIKHANLFASKRSE